MPWHSRTHKEQQQSKHKRQHRKILKRVHPRQNSRPHPSNSADLTHMCTFRSIPGEGQTFSGDRDCPNKRNSVSSSHISNNKVALSPGRKKTRPIGFHPDMPRILWSQMVSDGFKNIFKKMVLIFSHFELGSASASSWLCPVQALRRTLRRDAAPLSLEIPRLIP